MVMTLKQRRIKKSDDDTHPSHDGNGLEGKESGISDFIIYNGVKDFLFIISWEGALCGSRNI